jgi:hypothetical protein
MPEGDGAFTDVAAATGSIKIPQRNVDRTGEFAQSNGLICGRAKMRKPDSARGAIGFHGYRQVQPFWMMQNEYSEYSRRPAVYIKSTIVENLSASSPIKMT